MEQGSNHHRCIIDTLTIVFWLSACVYNELDLEWITSRHCHKSDRSDEFLLEVLVKKYFMLTTLVMLLALSACSGSADPDATKESKKPAEEAAPALPTLDTSLVEPSFPLPSDPEAYPEPEEPSGYPPPPIVTSTPYAYPEGTTFWITHAAGLQCEQPLIYPTLDDAVRALEENRVAVISAEAFDMMVCQACGCPTSEFYRANIDAYDLDTAISIGWNRE
jgi:hypothetical protein